MIDQVRVTPADVVDSGGCVRGARAWFHGHGLDFKAFLNGGIDVQTVRQINCPLANRACDVAEARAAGSNQR